MYFTQIGLPAEVQNQTYNFDPVNMVSSMDYFVEEKNKSTGMCICTITPPPSFVWQENLIYFM